MSKNFNEDSRVKLPALMHLHSLGYRYISSKELVANSSYDIDTNVITDLFSSKIAELNPGIASQEIKLLIEKIKIALDNNDLGREFYQILTAVSGVKLIDFDNPSNNDFACTTEYTCKNGEDEFRPDITLLVNGMPLAFIEVKKPNNRKGSLDERDRINTRFQNRKFRRFLNISQVLVFSNNMEYDSESIVPIEGAFYCTTTNKNAVFNCFREKDENFYQSFPYTNVDTNTENIILKDNNAEVVKHTPEYKTNRSVNKPTNRIITSLFSQDRFLFR